MWGIHLPFLGDAKATFKGYNEKIAQIILGPCMHGKTMEQMIKISDPENISIEHLIIHSSMMINLGNEKKWGCGVLQSTLKEADRLQRAKKNLKVGVVVHIGRGPGATIEQVVEHINRLVIPEGVVLYLENASGQGNEIGYNIDQLIELFETLPSKIKLCIDTQHAFGAGFCKWQTKEEVDDFFDLVEAHLPGRLELLHLNDSKVSFGSRIDRHEDIEKGYIWKEKQEGLKILLQHSKEKKIPLILETPNPGTDIQLLKNKFL